MIAESLTVRGGFTQATLELMKDLIDRWHVHPVFVMLAREISSQAGATTPDQEAEAIWSWVREHVTFRYDPVGAEWVQDPFETAVVSRAGDCDDMAVLAGTLLQAIGHPIRIAAVKWIDRDDYTHAVILDDRVGKAVDPVNPVYQPWPPPGRVVDNFLVAG